MTDASPALGPTQADIRTQADSPTPGGVQHPAIEIPRRARFEVLGAILLALLLGALDQTIVGTALPTIVTDLQGNDYYTWVITAYLLTSTITVPFYGKLSDIYGRKPLLIFGIVLFLVGSALSGLSQTMGQLILFRAIQGLGAGALFPISLAVIGDLFSPQERGKYQGLFGAVFGLAALVGPALGGFITDTLSWHWVFYINLPIGLLSLAVIARVLPSVRRRAGPHQLDYLGGALFTAGLVPFLIGLTNKQTGDWAEPAVGGFIVSSCSGCSSWPSDGRRSRSCRSTCGGTGPTPAPSWRRSSPRSPSSAPSSSCRGSSRWSWRRAPPPPATSSSPS
jgi:multidrug resistance protein